MRWRRWLLLWGGVVVGLAGAASAAAAPDAPRDRARLAGLRLPFIANEGQVDARVAFYAPSADGTLFVTREGELVYSLPAPTSGGGRERRAKVSRPGWTLTETLRGRRARPKGQHPSPTGVGYFLGNDPARWRPTVPTYGEVSLGEVWPGVTVALHARGRGAEKIFTVEPGASVARIRVRVGGATTLAVSGDGALVARTGLGPVTLTAPIAYQERDGVRRPVAVAYRLEGREYGFTATSYDPTLPLVIDPLLQSTYVGGGGPDDVWALAIHPTTGDVYVAGDAVSGFPGTTGGAQAVYGGGLFDAFVARLNGSLTTLLQATYLGGSDTESALAVAVHPTTGDIYVTGDTSSANFPATEGGAQETIGGGRDGFVARLNGSLTSLIQATYFGGGGDEFPNAIAIHPANGDVYISGGTSSTSLPRVSGGAQAVYGGGGSDGFVARLPRALTSVTQTTYLGGGQPDFAGALAIHPATGDVYASGPTASHDFPATAGSAQPGYGGGDRDGFVARLTSALTSLVKATYLGGTGNDAVYAMAIHPATGDVYAGGITASLDFPLTGGGAQPTFTGQEDAFVARLTSTLTSLTQATYLGGSGVDAVFALAIHPTTDDVYAAGTTSSPDFPGVTGGLQAAYGGGAADGFVARLPRTLTSITQATYLGGRGGDLVTAVVIRPTGDVYVAGLTSSSNFPGVSGGAQPDYGGGGGDGFAARLTFGLAAVDPGLSLTASVNQLTFTVGQTVTASASAMSSGVPGTADFYLGVLLPDGVTIIFGTGPGTWALGSLNDLRSFRPVASAVPLGTPFVTNLPSFVSYTWTGTEPRGAYTLFLLATRAGVLATGAAKNSDVLGLVTAPFSFVSTPFSFP